LITLSFSNFSKAKPIYKRLDTSEVGFEEEELPSRIKWQFELLLLEEK